MTPNNQPPISPTRLAATLSSAKVLVPRKEFGELIADSTWDHELVEVDGGYHAWLPGGSAASIDEDYVLHHWATPEEVSACGKCAMRPPRRPRGPMLAIDSDSAGAFIAERFGDNAIEVAGHRIVDCGNGIAVLDMHDRMLAWMNPMEMLARLLACQPCKCSHARAQRGAVGR